MTPKRVRFAAEYLVDLNATQAAIRAGYSEKTARAIGSELLTFPDIQAAIAEGRAKLNKTTEMDAEEWRRRVSVLARFDVRKLFDAETNKLLPVCELPDEIASCVAGVKVLRAKTSRRRVDAETEEEVEESLFEVKTTDVLRALEMMGRHLGMLKDVVDLNVTMDIADRLIAARKRLNGRA